MREPQWAVTRLSPIQVKQRSGCLAKPLGSRLHEVCGSGADCLDWYRAGTRYRLVALIPQQAFSIRVKSCFMLCAEQRQPWHSSATVRARHGGQKGDDAREKALKRLVYGGAREGKV